MPRPVDAKCQNSREKGHCANRFGRNACPIFKASIRFAILTSNLVEMMQKKKKLKGKRTATLRKALPAMPSNRRAINIVARFGASAHGISQMTKHAKETT